MKIKFSLLLIFSVPFLLMTTILGQSRNYTLNTGAGKISISSTAGESDCLIRLARKTIRRFECEYSPLILKHIKLPIAAFDEIIIFQEQTTAQSCDGKDVFILGLNKNGEYEFSESISYCGGPKPQIVVGRGKITIIFPAFKAFRGGFVNKETWVYENGELKQIRQRLRRRKK